MAYEKKCVICDDAITNPVCPECLEKQIMYWALDKESSVIPILKEIGRSVESFNHSNTRCVVCNNGMNVCPHCYCKEIYLWLVNNGYGDIASDFLEKFNYELDYKFDMKTQPTVEPVRIEEIIT